MNSNRGYHPLQEQTTYVTTTTANPFIPQPQPTYCREACRHNCRRICTILLSFIGTIGTFVCPSLSFFFFFSKLIK